MLCVMSNTTGGVQGASRAGRTSGIILLAAAVLTVVFMAMHPTGQSHGGAEGAGGMRGNGPVHGILISPLLLLALGYAGLAEYLGWNRVLVRAGAIACITGTAGGFAAGLINGFIAPAVAGGEGMSAALRLCAAANGACARVDVIGLSVAAILWGVCLLHRRGWGRVAGAVGLVCGCVPIVLLAMGRLPMDVRGFGLFVLVQGVWGVCAGVAVWRGR